MEYRLSDLFNLQMGKTPSRNISSYWTSGKYSWISISDLNNDKYINKTKEKISIEAVKKSGIKVIPANTVIMSFKLSIGKTAITSQDMYSNEAIMAFINKNKVKLSKDYIYYLLQSINWNTNKAVKGKTINKSIISATKVNIPSYKEQLKIAKILDTLIRRLNSKQNQLKKLDELIKARFVEMFGDPANPINIWDPEKLGKICILNPKKEKKLENDDLDVSFVPMSAVSENGAINTTKVKKYSEVKKGFTYFLENDVLFAKITPCMENGKGAVAIGLKNKKGFGSTEFHVLRPIKGKSNPYWLYTLTSFQSFRKLAELNMTGSAGQKRVPIKFLQNYKVVVPPISLQNEFANFVQQVDKSKFENIVYLNKTLSSKILSQIGDAIRD